MKSYISHHGIKGQKWGVRHGPPYPIEDKTLAKGTKLNSIEFYDPHNKGINKKDRWKYTFSADNAWDAHVYRGAYSYFKSRGGRFVLQESMYEVKKDLKMPTSAERKEAFKKIYDENKDITVKELKYVQRLMKEAGMDQDSKNALKRRAATMDLSNLKTKEDYDAAYLVFNHAMENVAAFQSTKKYAELMQTKYDAMVDDNNQGVYNHANDPIIVFDQSNLELKNTKMQTLREMYDNYMAVKEGQEKRGEKVML